MAGILTVEVLSVDQEVVKITEACLDFLKNEKKYIPYNLLWNRLRDLYDIPRKRVGHVVRLIRENVSIPNDRIIDKTDDITILT